MAGDPIYDTTTTSIRWNDTTATDYSEPTTTTGYYTYTNHPGIGRPTSKQEGERAEKIKKLIRKAIIQEMKDNWVKKPKHMKPIPIMRPTHQLQNICFGGRGWA